MEKPVVPPQPKTIRPRIDGRDDLSKEEKKRIYTRQYRSLNKEKTKAWNHKYYVSHRDAIIHKNTLYKRNKREAQKQEREFNKLNVK